MNVLISVREMVLNNQLLVPKPPSLQSALFTKINRQFKGSERIVSLLVFNLTLTYRT